MSVRVTDPDRVLTTLSTDELQRAQRMALSPDELSTEDLQYLHTILRALRAMGLHRALGEQIMEAIGLADWRVRVLGRLSPEELRRALEALSTGDTEEIQRVQSRLNTEGLQYVARVLSTASTKELQAAKERKEHDWGKDARERRVLGRVNLEELAAERERREREVMAAREQAEREVMAAREQAEREVMAVRERAERWVMAAREQAERGVIKRVSEIVSDHMAILARKYKQTVRPDGYGGLRKKHWCRELNYFLDHVVAKKVREEPCDSPEGKDELCRWIIGEFRAVAFETADKLVEETIQTDNPDTGSEFDDSMSGSDFERFCAHKLTLAGWRVQPIGGTGDQGGDIVVEKDGHRVLVQCKKYSAPIGNAAVQEAFAGKSYHEATAACVVSNVAYTRAAEQLAATTGVHLLHYSQLSDLGTLV